MPARESAFANCIRVSMNAPMLEKCFSTIRAVTSSDLSFSDLNIRSAPSTEKVNMAIITSKHTDSIVRADLKSPLLSLHISLNMSIVLKARTVPSSRSTRRVSICEMMGRSSTPTAVTIGMRIQETLAPIVTRTMSKRNQGLSNTFLPSATTRSPASAMKQNRNNESSQGMREESQLLTSCPSNLSCTSMPVTAQLARMTRPMTPSNAWEWTKCCTLI
mmetsp:Transcript_52824/g.150695  ORF Transcript_52824/g.150695 Transcript_52824/m.150695 type:complete len:218 (+) Transcript_52824:485-1138(+)